MSARPITDPDDREYANDDPTRDECSDERRPYRRESPLNRLARRLATRRPTP